jgi:hypothetical protein
LRFSDVLNMMQAAPGPFVPRFVRSGWNGKGQWVSLITKPADIVVDTPFFVLRNAQGKTNTWVPSVSDLLADDWDELKTFGVPGREPVEAAPGKVIEISRTAEQALADETLNALITRVQTAEVGELLAVMAFLRDTGAYQRGKTCRS